MAEDVAAWYLEADLDQAEEAEDEVYLAGDNETYSQPAPPPAPVTGSWSRPPAPPIDPNTTDLIFQHMETTYGIDPITRAPIVRIFGTTEQGNSVLYRTVSFRPYMYAQIPSCANPQQVRALLENKIRNRCRSKRDMAPLYVLEVERAEKRSMCGYQPQTGPMLPHCYKITLALPAHVRHARNIIEAEKDGCVYEANVPFELRFMVDTKFSGCQWLKLPAGTYRIIDQEHRSSNVAQYEVGPVAHCDYSAIVPLPYDTHGTLAPMRILSIDIETKRKKPGFCKAEEDPCVLICTVLNVVGTGNVHKAVFALANSMAPVPEADSVYLFEREADMLLGYVRYVREADPDCVTGWNITNFDLPYLVQRATVLGIHALFLDHTRIRGTLAWLKEETLQSKAYGAKTTHELVCEGRFTYDALIFMLRGQMRKFRSYKLNAISKELLKEQKLDVDYTQIPYLHEGTDEDRAHLALYCLRDALLPLQIIEHQMAIINGIEQSRVTGVPIKWLLSRGQGIKTFSNILRYKEPWEIVPCQKTRNNDTYTIGGYVRESIAGFYETPIVTLDFASLYPSIMQACNVCYSTVLTIKEAFMLGLTEGKDYWPIPGAPDYCFVARHVREGVLPKLLTSLLAQRAYVKRIQKDHKKGTDVYNVLESRQNALKVVCNSVYGFLKAFILVNPILMTAVTGEGQRMIKQCADLVVDTYKDHSFFPNDDQTKATVTYPARIVAGDTDSIMIDFGPIGIQSALKLGNACASMCTALYTKPRKLEFESIKLMAVIIKKKKYVSLEILAGDIKPDDTFETACARVEKLTFKGVETKRRDNAPIGSTTQEQLLELILLKRRPIEEAADYVRNVIRNIWLDRVDMGQYVITKGLSKTPEQYAAGGTKQVHTELKKRIAARAARTGEIVPETGDRVNYVMLAGTKKDKACERSEDPIYALKTGAPIDKAYYVRKQVMASTIKIFTAVWEPDKVGLIESSSTDKTLRQLRAYNELFAPNLPHMCVRKETKPRSFGISAFTVSIGRCAFPLCRVQAVKGKATCADHERNEAYNLVQAEYDRVEAIRAAAWARCRACAGDTFAESKCSNVVCDNYFHRTRATMDVEDWGKELERFETPDAVEQGVKRGRP